MLNVAKFFFEKRDRNLGSNNSDELTGHNDRLIQMLL